MATYKGTAGNDTLTGTDGNDDINAVQGGEDTINALGGNDVIHFNAAFDAGDRVDGGAGTDSVLLRGDYSAGLTFAATTMVNVEVLTLGAGFDYKLTTNDATVAAGQTLFVNAATLGASDTLTFDGSAETDGSFTIEGGKADDVITGGAGSDIIRMYQGGEDTIRGGGGNDFIYVGATLDAGDSVDGGAGKNTIIFNGDYSTPLTLGAGTVANIQEFDFYAGHSYNIVTNDADFTTGATIVINASHLTGSHKLIFDASADQDATFLITGGGGNDTIKGGQGADNFDLSLGGKDTVTGGASADVFQMGAALTAADKLNGGAGSDTVKLAGDYSAGLTPGGTTFTSIEGLALTGGHSYSITTNDGNVASGATLSVTATQLGATDTFTFNGGAETDGSFAIVAGLGNSTLTGGAQADIFNITRGGIDTIHGGGGDDTITVGATLTSADQIDGGTGNDTLKLNGDYANGISFGDATITSIETLSLAAGHSYKLTTADANVASGATMTVDASALGANDSLTFDGSAETDGSFIIKGGAGNDTIAVTAANASGDTIDGGAGNDTIALSGSGAVTLSGTKITNVETVSFADSGSYTATVTGNISSTNGALTLNAGALTASHGAGVDMSAATSTVNVTGGAGDDVVTVGSNLAHLGAIDGGAGTNTLAFGGNLVKPTLSGTNITHVEKLVFADGGSYPNIGISGDLTGTHGTLDVDASALTGSTSITISAIQATSGIDFTGGAGNDTLVLSDLNIANAGTAGDGGAGDNLLQIDTISSPLTLSLTGTQFQHFDQLDFAGSKNVTVGIANDFAGTASTLAIDAHLLSGSATVDASSIASATVAFTGGSGNDTILFSNTAHNWGALDGGTGNNTLKLTGGGSATLSGGTIKEFTALTLTGGHYSQVTVTGDITTGGASLSIDASASTGANIDLSAATTSLVNVTGGTGDDYVIFHAFNAAATFVGGDGYNEIAYQTPQSGMTFTSANYSNVDEIDFNGIGNYTNIAVVGDLTAGGDNAGDIDIYAGVLTGKIAVDLSAVTTSEIDFGGSSGDDTVTLSTANFNGTFLNGQAGNDTVIIAGNGTDFTAHTLTNANARNIANFDLTGDNNFSLKFAAGIGEATNSVSVDASALTAGHSASVDFSHATTNALSFTGGAGDDTVLFSAASLAHASGVSGGGGGNTFALTGDGQDVNTTFNGDTFAFFSTLAFENGNNYDVTVASPFFTGVAAPLTIDASALSASYGATVDVTAIAGTVNFTGGAGNDTVIFSSDNDNWGTVNGGAGDNIFEFNDGSAAVVSGASVTNFSTLSFADGHDYSGIQVTGDITGNNGTLTVDSSAVSGGHIVQVDLSGVTSSGIVFTGGAADDTVVFGANLANVVSADGGGGTNTLALTGGGQDVTTTFSGANLANFSGLALEDGNNYDITVTGGFGGEAGLNIDASALSARYGATIDASGLTNFSVDFTGGAGDDTVLAGADLGNMTIGGGGGSDVLKLDGDYSAGVTLSSVTNIGEIDLAGGNSYNLTTTDATVAAGATLTVDASALGPNSSLTFDGSAETDGYFAIKGGAGDDSLTLQTLEVDNSSIDGGAGVNTLTLTGAIGGDESFNAASITDIDNIAYVAGSDAGGVSFTGDITGDGGTLTVDETNADGEGGSGPDGDMLLTDISALTDTIDLTGGVIDDYVSVSSQNWTSLNGNGGNYNAINDVGTGPITFDAATITGFNALVFANSTDYSGITVIGDITGNGGTVAIDAAFANSISIDVSQATSSFAFTGSAGDDTIAFGNGFTSGDTVAGNGGSDTLSLGRNIATLADTAVTGVGTVKLSGGSAFAVIGDITSGGGTLTVDASALSDPHDQANIDFSQATTKTIDFTGGVGGDRVTFDASEGNWGTVDGGGGINNFILNTGGIAVIDGASVTDFSSITLRDGGAYFLTLTGDIQGGGQALSVNAGALTGSNSVFVDAAGSADKIGFTGGQGNDSFTGSSHGDTIDITAGGYDTVTGGSGDDSITASSVWISNDSIDGGDGSNTLNLSGSGASFGDTNVRNIQTLNIGGDTTISGNIAGSGETLAIVGTGSSGFTLDLSGATTTSISVTGTSGDDTVIFGSNVANAGTVDGGAGNDTLALAGGVTGVTLSDSAITHIDQLHFADDGQLYYFGISGDITGGGGTLTIDASSVTNTNESLSVDASAATTATIDFLGGAADDTIEFSGTAANWGTVDGGGGNNTLLLADGATGATISDSTVSHIDELSLANFGPAYNVTVTGDITAGDGTLLVNAGSFGPVGGGAVTVDLSGATTAAINIVMGGGDDTVIFGQPSFFAEESYDGGDGTNTISIAPNDGSLGPFEYNLSDAFFTNLDELDLQDGSNQGVQVTGDVSHTGTLKIDASAMSAAYSATIDASAATSTIDFTGGAGDDTITISASQIGTIDGGAGNDTVVLSAAGTLDASQFTSVENFSFTGDASSGYTVDVIGDLTGNGSSGTLSLDFHNVHNGGVTVDLTSATTGNFTIAGSGGDDTVIITAGENLTGYVQWGGFDTLELSGGSTSFTLDHATLGEGFCFLTFADGASYSGVTLIGDIANNTAALTVDASALTGANLLDIDLSRETYQIYATGGAGDDTFTFGQSIFSAASTVNGGAGNNTLVLNNHGSDFSGTLQDSAVQNIETIVLTDGNNYSVTVSGDVTSGHGALTVDASAVSSAYGADIELVSATTATLFVTGGAGDDTVSPGDAANVTVDFSHGGNDTFYGGSGTALVEMGATLTAGDFIDGVSTGQTTVSLDGDYSAGLTLSMLSGVNEVDLAGGHSYDLTAVDADVGAGGSFTVNGSGLGASDVLTFDGSAETDGSFIILGGAGADILTGGAQADTFAFADVGNSTGAGHDTITNVNFGGGNTSDTLTTSTSAPDKILLDSGSDFSTHYVPTGIDAAITSGSLSTASFDADLAAAVNAGTLAANHAVLFTADSGTLSGHTFLVVDHNGTAGYQMGADYVIDVTGYAGTLTTGSFI